MKHSSGYVPALGYHWLTRYYDVVVGKTTRERTFKQALIRQANFEPGHRVLDLACGTGTLSIWVKQQQPLAPPTRATSDADHPRAPPGSPRRLPGNGSFP